MNNEYYYVRYNKKELSMLYLTFLNTHLHVKNVILDLEIN